MKLITNAPRGTSDILPCNSFKWEYIENMLRLISSNFNFEEIRFPTFEHTELFNRAVGDTTDVVQKEMYTFFDKGERSITLRPEGTASAMRCVLQNGLYGEALPLKLFYIINCFRYEKPQAGRFREFHQFGIEMYGTKDIAADVEVISFAQKIFDTIGLENISLEINSIGCKQCRGEYHKALIEYFNLHINELCSTCKDRLLKNPMRIFDCKSSICNSIATTAPKITDYLCENCENDFNNAQKLLNAIDIKFTINSNIVRGLDYYNGLVFEFVSKEIGSQGTVAGGGRYDNLSAELSDVSIPGLGFAMGIERLILLMDKQNKFNTSKHCPDIFIATLNKDYFEYAFKLTNKLRKCNFSAECDLSNRSLKAQMKYANKINAKYVLVIGDNEISTGFADIKEMGTGEAKKIKLDVLEDFLLN